MNLPIYHFALREDLKEDKRFLPARAESAASGWDTRAAMSNHKSLTIEPFEYVKIPLGFRIFCPDGWWLELKPRSSSFAKRNLHALYGTIDSSFEGEAVFACQYIPNKVTVSSRLVFQPDEVESEINSPYLTIEFGDALGQLIPVKRQEFIVAEVSNEQYDAMCKERNGTRGTGGFGSTGS